MRDLILGCVATAVLLSAFHTVQVRREVYALGHEIGTLERALAEQRRWDDNMEIQLERLLSPKELIARASEADVVLEAGRK